MTSFRECNLRCAMCGEGYYSASPIDQHGDLCDRRTGMLVLSRRLEEGLRGLVREAYIDVGVDAMERFANGKDPYGVE